MIDHGVGFGVHSAGDYAIIGSLSQAGTSDNRDCDIRKVVANNRMATRPTLRPEAEAIFGRLDALGLTQRELAVALGIQENKVSKVRSGERQFKAPEVLAAHKWLDKQEGHGLRSEAPPDNSGTPELVEVESDEDNLDNVNIQEWDIAYGMGGGSYLDLPVTGTLHTFSRSWLRNFTHAPPDKIFLARGAGDSMFPTILDSDIVLIDTSDREIRVGDKIWAVVYGTTGYIKRIRPMPDGSVKMLSDNQNVPPETAYDGELSVVGRVVAIVRKT